MSFDPMTVLAIMAMGLATYGCRAGGYWIFRQIRPSPTMRAILAYVPGTLFVSYVVPALVNGGVQPIVGAAATLAAMLLTRNLVAGIASGVAAAWIVWLLR
jgi:uncharacterized membrane protein